MERKRAEKKRSGEREERKRGDKRKEGEGSGKKKMARNVERKAYL